MTPDVVLVVNTMLAVPLASVVDVAVANDPPAPVLLHVTTCPGPLTAVPVASVSCAVTVTGPPAATDDALAVTTYFDAGPPPLAIVVIGALAPVTAPVVAVTTCAVATVVDVVKLTVATPLAFVLLVALANEPPFVLDQVTVCPAVPIGLLFASANCADTVTAVPATGDELLGVTRYLAAAPAIVATFPLDPVRLLASVAVNA